jgi:hypothetical protein
MLGVQSPAESVANDQQLQQAHCTFQASGLQTTIKTPAAAYHAGYCGFVKTRLPNTAGSTITCASTYCVEKTEKDVMFMTS